MHTQMYVCNQITFDSNLKEHHLGTVINRVKIKVLPCVIKLPFLIKLIDMPKNEEVYTEIKIVDSLHNVLSTHTYVYRNYRKKDEIPGVDQNLIATLLIENTGTLFFECHINGSRVNWYPVEIFLEENVLLTS